MDMYLHFYVLNYLSIHNNKQNSIEGNWKTQISTFMTGPEKTGYICKKYTCSEDSTFLGLCL